jgi:menaquinone-dependent protoporphyrinogen oxidase
MKTLILYASKHGAAAEIARRISKHFGNAAVHDLKQDAPSLDGFDCVIIGSALYAGMIRKEAKSYMARNAALLCNKKLGLYLCGLDDSKEADYFKNNFPPEVLQPAKAKAFLGGIFDPKKAGFMERMIMKAVAKQSEYTDNIDDSKIKQFAEVMKA